MTTPAIPEPRPAAAVEASLEQIRDAARQVHRVHAVLHHSTERAVRAARLDGQSWATIGRQLGVSKQAAMKRFRYLDQLPVEVHRGFFRCPGTGLEWRASAALENGVDQVLVVEAGEAR